MDVNFCAWAITGTENEIDASSITSHGNNFKQWRAGYKVFTADKAGLAYCVANFPGFQMNNYNAVRIRTVHDNMDATHFGFTSRLCFSTQDCTSNSLKSDDGTYTSSSSVKGMLSEPLQLVKNYPNGFTEAKNSTTKVDVPDSGHPYKYYYVALTNPGITQAVIFFVSKGDTIYISHWAGFFITYSASLGVWNDYHTGTTRCSVTDLKIY